MHLINWIAGKYLKGRKTNSLLSGITLISVLGITVGVMTLTVVLSVMDGFENDLRSKVLGVNSHVIIQNRFGYDVSDIAGITETVSAIKGVVHSAPYVHGEGLVMKRGRNYTAVLRGIDPAEETRTTSFGDIMSEGSLEKGGVAIGREMATLLNVAIGEKIRLLSPDGKVTPVGIFPRVRDYKVTGIFESGMYEYDTSLVYLTYEDALSFLSRKGASGISVKIEDIGRADKVAEEMNAVLPEEYRARGWFRMNRNLYSAMELEKKTMFIILTLIILVASFNIVATLVTMVKEKTKEIGIMKSLGFTPCPARWCRSRWPRCWAGRWRITGWAGRTAPASCWGNF